MTTAPAAAPSWTKAADSDGAWGSELEPLADSLPAIHYVIDASGNATRLDAGDQPRDERGRFGSGPGSPAHNAAVNDVRDTRLRGGHAG